MTLEEMLARVEAIEAITDPLMEELGALEMEIRKIKAAEWIAANGVTRDNVQITMGGNPELPFLQDCAEAAIWIRSLPAKHPFVEWNSHIYSREQFMSRQMEPYTTAMLCDLQ